MAKLVSKTYGDALFELALEKGILDDVCEEMTEIGRIWKDNKELTDVILHPRVTAERLKQLRDFWLRYWKKAGLLSL